MNNTNAVTVETYNKMAVRFQETSPQVVSGNLKEWIDAGLSKLNKTAKILEIGSGTGKDADYIEAQGFTMECTDASEGFVELLKEKGRQARVLDAIKDEPGAGYDLVFANAVLLHFTEDETETVLKKVYAALNDDGYFMLTLKCGEGDEITSRKLELDRYFKYWQAPAITKLLQSTGFTDINAKTLGDFRNDGRPDWLYITAKRGVK